MWLQLQSLRLLQLQQLLQLSLQLLTLPLLLLLPLRQHQLTLPHLLPLQLLRHLLSTNQLGLKKTDPRVGFFSSANSRGGAANEAAGVKKPAHGRFFSCGADAYFNSSASILRIFAPIGVVSGLPSLVCTVTALAVAGAAAGLTVTR